MIGHAVTRSVQCPEHFRRQARLDVADAFALQMHGGNTHGGLDPGPHSRGADIVMPLVDLQVTGALEAGGRAELHVERGPQIVRQTHQRQFTKVTPIGAHATLAEPARGARGDLVRLEHEHVGPAPGERPRGRHAVDAAADYDTLRPHRMAPRTRRPVVNGRYLRGLRGIWVRVSGTKCSRAGIFTAASVVLSITASAAMSSLAFSRKAVSA